MNISAAATKKMIEFLEKEQIHVKPKGFRVGVMSGGCSGFSYTTAVDEINEEDELIFLDDNKHNVAIIDPKSKDFLKSVAIDYKDTIGFSGFVFSNPDASSSCGCGISFDL